MYFSVSARLYSCGNKDAKLKSCVEPDAVILYFLALHPGRQLFPQAPFRITPPVL